MSLLHSYSFTREPDPRTYLLFSDMLEHPERKVDCSLEVIDAAARGEFDLNRVEKAAAHDELNKVFNLWCYDYEVNHRKGLVSYKDSQKNLHISAVDENGVVDSYGVPESVLTEYAKPVDAYEELDDQDEFEYACSELVRFRNVSLVEYKLDCLHAIRQALKGIPGAVAALKRLSEQEPHTGECIRLILSSGKELDRLWDMEKEGCA